MSTAQRPGAKGSETTLVCAVVMAAGSPRSAAARRRRTSTGRERYQAVAQRHRRARRRTAPRRGTTPRVVHARHDQPDVRALSGRPSARPPTRNARRSAAEPRPLRVPAPPARTVYPDWIDAADEQVSRLRPPPADGVTMRTSRCSWTNCTRLPTLTTAGRPSATSDKRRGTTRIVHPNLGRLRLDYEVLLLPDDADEQRLVTWLPADDATAAALARTADMAAPTSPAQLRVIG